MRRSHDRVRWLAAWMAGAALCLAPACRRQTSSDQPAEVPASVTTQLIRPQTLRNTINTTGVVAPARAGDWTITSTETGRIVELPKAEGDPVKTGDVLVRFDFSNLTEEVAARQV